MFINKIKDSMEPSKTTTREIEFIHTVGKNSHYKSSAREQAFKVLWQVTMMEKPGYSSVPGHCYKEVWRECIGHQADDQTAQF
jgi:hypothetical protein